MYLNDPIIMISNYGYNIKFNYNLNISFILLIFSICIIIIYNRWILIIEK